MEYSIAVYKDKKESILIIPDSFDEYGIRRNLNYPIILELPYDEFIIGKSIKEAFEICLKNSFQHSSSAQKVYEIVTGIKSWSKFSKERKFVGGLYNPEKGYEFEPWKRQKDGSYMSFGVEPICCGLNAENFEIGIAVTKAFLMLD